MNNPCESQSILKLFGVKPGDPLPSFEEFARRAKGLPRNQQQILQRVARTIMQSDEEILEKVRDQTVHMMERAGIHPALCFAFVATDQLLCETNLAEVSEAALLEWNQAIDDYVDAFRGEEPPQRWLTRHDVARMLACGPRPT